MKTQAELEMKQELKRTLALNLSAYSAMRGLKQIDIARKLGVTKGAVSMWYNPSNSTMPSAETLQKISQILDVSMEALTMGETPHKIAKLPRMRAYKGNIHKNGSKWVVPEIMIYRIPVYESVSAGFGSMAIDAAVDYTLLPFSSKSEADETICIRVQGDSMSPKIESGDLIQVHKQTSVDSGDIAVILLDGDNGLVKKVEYTKDTITLMSLNLSYPPIILKGNDMMRVSIVGKVRRIIRDV